jgi:peptidoglycan/xylan/chitin deacetylase (PgdA/CDA1 family)
LIYHNIADTVDEFPNALSKDEFESHLVYIKQNFNPVRMAQSGEIVDLDPSNVNMLITFDDGFRNNYDVAFPLLVKHGLSACFFVIADCAIQGSMPAMAHRYVRSERASDQYATIAAPQLREMATAGMTIGSHSLSHRDYTDTDFDTGLADARASRKALEDLLGLEIGLFAFPWGRSRPGQSEALQAIYARIFTTQHGMNAPDDRVMRRNETVSRLHLAAVASGTLHEMEQLLRRG